MTSKKLAILALIAALGTARGAAAQDGAEPAGDLGTTAVETAAPTTEAAVPAPASAPAEAPAPSPVVDDPGAGPTLDLPDEVAPPPPPEDAGPAFDPMRGMQEARFARAATTAIGGYGELHLNIEDAEGGGWDPDSEVDLHRLVLFVAHNFAEDFRFYTEIEVEHALVGGGGPGEVGIEQAYVDWTFSDAIGLRAGIVLVPMGIVNQWHEPPIFHGVERPRVDNRVIPSTWREAGIGVFGEPVEGLRYEAYLTSGLDASGFSGGGGIRGGRLKVAEARANGPAATFRLEYEPALGVVLGAAGYFGLAGPNATGVGESVPVSGFAVDGRLRRAGFEARAVAAWFGVGDTDALRQLDADGEPISDVGSSIFGAYGEVAYDVLWTGETEQQLLPFVRMEWLDLTLGEDDAAFDRPSELRAVIGLSYRPIPQLVFKADATLVRPSQGDGENIYAAGVGWMF